MYTAFASGCIVSGVGFDRLETETVSLNPA
jgi:hypothetical protein